MPSSAQQESRLGEHHFRVARLIRSYN